MTKAKSNQKAASSKAAAKQNLSNTGCYTSAGSPTQPHSLSVYKNKRFDRFQRDARISDADLWSAATDAAAGDVDADLGGGVIKQRIAREGGGKSSGSRAIILFRKGNRAVFVFGFEKKDLPNIKPDELVALRKLADEMLGYTTAQLAQAVKAGALIEVPAPKEKTSAKKVPKRRDGSNS